jgi:hypothetical protein
MKRKSTSPWFGDRPDKLHEFSRVKRELAIVKMERDIL